MEFEIFSYRYAKEILENSSVSGKAFQEIIQVITECPLYIYPQKSSKNKKLDVVQQVMNTYFDRKFVIDKKWEYHPPATSIKNSKLKADFRKRFSKDLTIQTEAQFGNMSRWYTDIFKFQAAYSKEMIDLGLCLVPMFSLAKRIDSNVTNFERCIKELPEAKLSITLPIMIIGLYVGKHTIVHDLSQSGFKGIKGLTAKGNSENRFRLVNGLIDNLPIQKINSKSKVGPKLEQTNEEDDELD